MNTRKTRKVTITDYLKNPTAASYDAMVEQMRRAAYNEFRKPALGQLMDCEGAALASVGITRPKEGK